MGEVTNTQTENTEVKEQTAVENTAAEAQQSTGESKPAECAEQKEATATESSNAEEKLTIDSYNETLGLTANEDVFIDKDLLNNFKQFALENGIKPDMANKIAKFQFEAVEKQAQYMKNLQAKWAEENAKTYGDNLKNVQTNVGRVLAEFDKTGKFKELLTLAGAENAPATLAFLKAIGDSTLEKGSVNPNTQKVEKDLTDMSNLYPNN